VPQQVGQANAAADIPVFYAPPPGEPENAAASFLSNFMRVRNPWATDLFRARLKALDPNEKAKLLLAAKNADNDAKRAALNAANVAAQTNASLYKAILAAKVQEQATQAKLSIANLESGTERFLAETALQEDTGQKQIAKSVLELLQVGVDSGTPEGLAHASRLAKARLEDLPGNLTASQRRAVERVVHAGAANLQGVQSDEQVRQIRTDIGTTNAPIDAPEGAGVADINFGDLATTTQQVAPIASQPDSASVRTSTRQTVPGAEGTPTPTAAPGGAPFVPTAVAPATQGAFLDSFERSLQGPSALGEVGAPVFTKPDPRVDALNSFGQQADAGGISTFLQALEGTKRGPFPGVRAAKQAKREAAIAQGALDEPLDAEISLPEERDEIERFLPTELPKGNSREEVLVERDFLKGQGSLDDVIAARQKEQERLRREAELQFVQDGLAR